MIAFVAELCQEPQQRHPQAQEHAHGGDERFAAEKRGANGGREARCRPPPR
jgi:hypothetical protein